MVNRHLLAGQKEDSGLWAARPRGGDPSHACCILDAALRRAFTCIAASRFEVMSDRAHAQNHVRRCGFRLAGAEPRRADFLGVEAAESLGLLAAEALAALPAGSCKSEGEVFGGDISATGVLPIT